MSSANKPEQVARAICQTLCRGDFQPHDTDNGVTCKPEACKHWQLYFEAAHILYMLYPALAKDATPTQSQVAFRSADDHETTALREHLRSLEMELQEARAEIARLRESVLDLQTTTDRSR